MKVNINNYNFIVGIPSSALKNIIADVPNHYYCTNESEAIGMAVGAYLAGKKPLVYMQDDGIGRIITDLATLVIPYKIELFILIGHRSKPEQHEILGRVVETLLQTIGFTNYEIV